MKILQMNPAFYPASAYGGTVEVSYRLSKELVRRGHEVTVYTSDTLDKYHRQKDRISEFDGIKVYYFKNLSNKLAWHRFIFTPGMLPQLRKELKNFDIIHLHGSRNFQNVFAHYYAKKYEVPYVLQAHGSLPRVMAKQRLKWIYDAFFGYRLLRDASKVIALNHAEAEQYRSMGVRDEKIEIIPNGIDLTQYNVLPLRGAFKNKYNIPLETKIILFLGRIHKIKGIDILVKAFSQVIEKVDNVKLVIVGPDDGYLKDVMSLVNDLKLDHHVVFTGPLYREEKLEAYVDADVYVLPSRYEIFGMTVLEAYSCGKPVIASKVGGLKELVIDGETGLLFEPENIGQLEESLCFMLESPNVAKKMGIKGKQFVKENFTIEKVVDMLENLYEEIKSEVIYQQHTLSEPI